MKYVSKVYNIDTAGVVTTCGMYEAPFNVKMFDGSVIYPGVEVDVTDLETGEVSHVNRGDCGNDILGIHDSIVLTHERHTAMLHRYIKSITQSPYSECEVWFPPETKFFDWLLRGFADYTEWRELAKQEDYLAIDFGVYDFDLVGVGGNIVESMPLGRKCAGRLYDALRAFCVMFGAGILKFRHIYWVSSDATKRGVIELDQDSDEAKRYFIKMGLEVTSGCNTFLD